MLARRVLWSYVLSSVCPSRVCHTVQVCLFSIFSVVVSFSGCSYSLWLFDDTANDFLSGNACVGLCACAHGLLWIAGGSLQQQAESVGAWARWRPVVVHSCHTDWTITGKPASADRTARRQFQATGQPVSRTQASDAMTSRLPRYEPKCVQRRCFQWDRSNCVQILRERSYPLPIYWCHSKGNWSRYNFVSDSFYIMKLCSRLFVLYCRNCPNDDKFR